MRLRIVWCVGLLTSVPALSRPVGECPSGMLAVGADGRSLEAFCLDTTEVTVADYQQCVDAGACTPSPATVAGPDIPRRHVPLWSRSCNAGREGREGHPINCVDWEQAETFCAAAGKRLPDDEEWRWAAAGGDEARRYPWGRRKPTAERLNACDFECLDRLRQFGLPHATLHYGEDGHADTAPVGSFPAGAGRWGHLDLAGNVWEFTASRFAADERVRVIRGGGWAQSDRSRVETSYRGGFLTTARGSAIGFRCARALGN